MGFGTIVLQAVAWLIVAGELGQDARPALVPIAEVVANAAIDQPYPVRVRGVVTWRRNRGIIIQHEQAGIWIDAQSTPQSGLWRCDEAALESVRPGM